MMPNSSPKKPAASRAWIIAAIVLVLGFDLAFLWQRRASATASELGGHPDEAAHYITGLAFQNYLATGLASGPQKSFADFSAHYPNVRPLASPPLFPIVQAAWTTAFGKSRASLLFMMCLLAALVALLLYFALRADFGEAAAVIAAALFISLPLVREHTATLLPPLLCTACMLAAALAFARFLERERLADALLFGLASALAILTDQMGLALALFVPLALLLSRKWTVLARPQFWIGIALAAAPAWYFHASNWTPASLSFSRAAVPFFAAELASAVGIILFLFAVPSLITQLTRPAERTALWSVAAALLVAPLLFLFLAPAELEPSGLLPALPAALMFATAGCAAIAKRLSRSTGFILVIVGVLTLMLSETVMVTWRTKKWSGFHPLVEIVLDATERPLARVLVCSDHTGEGMCIAEFAMHEKQPARFIQSAAKLFASTRFGDEEELSNLLLAQNFDYIVLDESNPDLDRAPLHDMLRRTLKEKTDRFWEMSSAPVVRDGIVEEAPARLYRVMGRN